MKASSVPVSAPKVVERQEVIPVHYNELSQKKVFNPKKEADLVAIHLAEQSLPRLLATPKSSDLI